MGLTIHWSLKARGSERTARKLIEALRQTALDLPVNSVGEIADLSGDACKFELRSQDDPLRWLLVQATESVDVVRRSLGPGAWSVASKNVSPQRVIAFEVDLGAGSEPANFGLCRYPAEIEARERGVIKTKLGGWRWQSFCKTQYASNPDCGGVPNFLRCHLSVVALLDKAKELGCLADVSDEGGFWEKRDLPALLQEIGSWNEMIAAFGGKLKDLLADGSLGVESAISQYPNVEQLEAAGQSKLPPGREPLAKLIQRVTSRSEFRG